MARLTKEERRANRAARKLIADGKTPIAGTTKIIRKGAKRRARKPRALTKKQVDQVVGALRVGADLGMAARAMGVDKKRLYLLMDGNADFRDAVLEARNYADERIVKALYDKALAGDVKAMMFWLKNRKRNEWRDRYEHSVETDERRGPHVVVFATGEVMAPAAAGLPAAYSDQPSPGRPDDIRPAGGQE